MNDKTDNVIHLNNEHIAKLDREEAKRRKQQIFKRRRIAGIFVASMILFTLPSIHIFEAYNELVANKAELAKSVKQQVSLEAEKKQLEKQVALLHDDDYVAKVARSKYLYSKDGEKVYFVPEFSDGSSNDNE